MYQELIVAIEKKMDRAATEQDVITYINQTFGLRGTVKDITLV